MKPLRLLIRCQPSIVCQMASPTYGPVSDTALIELAEGCDGSSVNSVMW
jgi:hypothetical protein